MGLGPTWPFALPETGWPCLFQKFEIKDRKLQGWGHM